MTTASTQLTLTNAAGLHARPASLFVQTAARFHSEIQVRFGEKAADAKRILQVLQLGARHGDTIEIRATGDDAREALEALEALITRQFGESD